MDAPKNDEAPPNKQAARHNDNGESLPRPLVADYDLLQYAISPDVLLFAGAPETDPRRFHFVNASQFCEIPDQLFQLKDAGFITWPNILRLRGLI